MKSTTIKIYRVGGMWGEVSDHSAAAVVRHTQGQDSGAVCARAAAHTEQLQRWKYSFSAQAVLHTLQHMFMYSVLHTYSCTVYSTQYSSVYVLYSLARSFFFTVFYLAAGVQEDSQRRRRVHCRVGDDRRRRRTQVTRGRNVAKDLICNHDHPSRARDPAPCHPCGVDAIGRIQLRTYPHRLRHHNFYSVYVCIYLKTVTAKRPRMEICKEIKFESPARERFPEPEHASA